MGGSCGDRCGTCPAEHIGVRSQKEEEDIQMNLIVMIVLIALNLLSFGLMAYDKHCAKAGKWRIPEKTLFLAAACFGGLGGVLGMTLCRHKTKHWYFKVFFPVFLTVQIVLLFLGVRYLPWMS